MTTAREKQIEGIKKIQEAARTQSSLADVSKVLVDLLNNHAVQGATLDDAAGVVATYISMLVDTFQYFTKRSSFLQNLHSLDAQLVDRLVSEEFNLAVASLFRLPENTFRFVLSSTLSNSHFTLYLHDRVVISESSPDSVRTLAQMLVSVSFDEYLKANI